MFNKPIPQLPAALELQDSDLLALSQADLQTRKIELGALRSMVTSITTVTYAELKTLIETSSLVTGTHYRFEYQTIHKIPYTNDVNTGPVEVLIVMAITTNKVHHQVMSESYPEDIIFWRWDDNILLDQIEDTLLLDGTGNPYLPPPLMSGSGVNAYSPSTNRPGRIYFREDTLYRNCAPYDFRAVKFRRWKIKTPFNITSTIKTWADDTSYTQGDIIESSGVHYIALTTFNSGTGSDITLYAMNISSLLSHVNFGLYYLSPVPDTYTLIPASGVYTGLSLEVDNTIYHDFTTFDNLTFEYTGFNPDNSTSLKNFNCRIKNYLPAWLEQVAWEYYPNVVFFSFANNIEVGIFSENLNIVNSCNLNIGSYNKFGYINTFNSFLCETVIGNNNDYIFLTSAANDVVDINKQYQSIGAGNKGLVITLSNNFQIGNHNYGLLMSLGSRNIIGNGNTVPFLVGANRDCVLGNTNTQITFSNSAVRSECGNNNVKGFFHPSSSNNKVGNNNFDFSGLLATGTTIEGVYASIANGNCIGNNTSGIRFVGSYNVFNDRCNSVSASPNILIHNSVFDVWNSSGVHFYSATDTPATINQIHFKIPISNTASLIEMDAHPGCFQGGLNYNESVGAFSSDSIFARTVINYTDLNTYVETLLKITMT